MKKRNLGIIAAMLALCMVLVMLPAGVYADEGWDGVTETEPQGTGDPDTPYLISTPEELAWFRTQVNSGEDYLCAKLTADIDLNNRSWTPIGIADVPPNSLVTSEHAFRGTFDGDGKTISGLCIDITADDSSYQYFGLFGAAVGKQGESIVTIKNLTVKGNITIDTSSHNVNHIGGICGCGGNIEISGCASEVNISVTGASLGENVAGIIGNALNQRVTLTECINKGSINGNIKWTGGLCAYGSSKNSVFSNCCNLGSISGNTYVGGLLGQVNGTVKNCYNAGSITATDQNAYSGGILACTNGTSNLTIDNCFTTGTCSFADANNTGAVYGSLHNKYSRLIVFSNVFYLADVCERPCGLLAPKYLEGDSTTECIRTISKTAEEIASDEFVTLLNTNAESVLFKKGATHPIFTWQPDEVTPVVPVIKGDINKSGAVDEYDVTLLIGHVIGTDILTETDALTAADINDNGYIDENDVTYIIQLYFAQ